VTTADWIRLAITGTAAVIAVWSAALARRAAKQARANLARAQANARRATGAAVASELTTMKIRQLRKRK
jgi:hypothetical protein